MQFSVFIIRDDEEIEVTVEYDCEDEVIEDAYAIDKNGNEVIFTSQELDYIKNDVEYKYHQKRNYSTCDPRDEE